MKNKAIDLHNHLFEQLERLNDTSIKGDDLANEIKRSEAMTRVALAIVANGRMVIDAHKMAEECGVMDMPDMLESGVPHPNKPRQITGAR